jgi:membrane protease YdiL (CAAX protease family)
MAVEQPKRAVGILLIGLPILSNVVSFVIFAPLFMPGKVTTAADFQRAGHLVGVAILVIEILALFLVALSVRHRSRSLVNLINCRPRDMRLYLITALIASLPTIAAGWLYSMGQAQTGVESEWSRLTCGEIVFWYVITPIGAAFLEETIWRGYAIPRIKGGWRSLLLSSLSFAFFHGIFNPLVVVATFVQGLIWGWVYQRTESTVPSMALHFLSRYLALVF